MAIYIPTSIGEIDLENNTNSQLLAQLPPAVASEVTKQLPTAISTNATVISKADKTEVESGWITSNDTWVYTSANSFTIAGSDKTNVYQTGDKIKLTSNGIDLYGYITKSAYYPPNTVITIAGNILTNYPFTNNCYSRAVNPFNFPDTFSWTPTLTWGTATPSISSIVARHKIMGNTDFFNLAMGLGDGKGATSLTITLPVQPKVLSALVNMFVGFQQINNITNVNVLPFNSVVNNTINFATFNPYTNGQVGQLWISGHYEITTV